MRARDLSDDALNTERIRLLAGLFERVGCYITPAQVRRYAALTREAERRWPRVTKADLARVRRETKRRP